MGKKPSTAQGGDYDVVVIGGGINGTSSARELARAGYAVLLVEKDDFAAGASSRSSRILHCGLRYFESPRPIRSFALHPVRFARALRMARASMQARYELATACAEHVRPFTMCFPIYKGGDIRGWHLDAGFRLLGHLGPKQPPLDYKRLTSDIEGQLPFARDLRDRQRLQAVATYREYVFDWPERLCVDAALEAEGLGATIRNFCSGRIIGRDSDGLWQVELTETGGAGVRSTVRAAVVLNMAGSWIDAVNADTGQATRRLVQGTKGAHILVRLPDAYRGFGIATLHRGGMPFYCLPSHEDYFYFGPTESLFEGDAANVSASEEDIDFLLAEANFMLPGLRLTRRDIAFTWAGVRPLTFDREQPMGRRTRDIHDLTDQGLPGLLAMTAGPIMTHRSAGREMCAAVAARLRPSSHPRAAAPKTAGVCARIGINGSEPLPSVVRAAVQRAVEQEHARDLKGVLFTRTGLAWRRHLDRHEVAAAAEVAAPLLGWTQERTEQEVASFLEFQRTVFPTATSGSAVTAVSEN